MPNREDESWLNLKDDIRYCSKHQRYYDEKFGCQICFLEGIEEDLKRKVVGEIPQLQICPKCKQKSLFWNKDFKLFECLNPKCKKLFAQSEINQEMSGTGETSEIQKSDKQQMKQDVVEQKSLPSGRAWFNNEYFDPKDRKWKKPKRKLFPFGK